MERGSRKRSSSARSEKKERAGERIGKKKKNGRILCDRPKPTAGSSANGRRRKKIAWWNVPEFNTKLRELRSSGLLRSE